MRRNSMPVLCMIMTLVLLFSSCSHGFLKDPRLYNSKKNNKQASQDVAAEPELGLTGGIDAFDKTEEWYNNPQSNGDETNKEAVGFAASEFDTIQITGWFSNKNVPTYTMTGKDVWSAGDQAKGEYIHSNAPNTEGQGWSITGVTYYQYRGLNPSYAPDGNYNTVLQVTGKGNPKLNRFYFYRFTGKGGGIQWLDNNLIAVDTYSKLVFAFSEPVEFSSMGAPTKWSPTDKDPFFGQMYQFYMYDPVGYVLKNDDGSYDIKLYQWFQDSLASGNYKANINTAYTKIAEKKPDGAGKSPFNNHSVDFFTENMKLLAGTTFYRREVKDGVNGLVLYKYLVSKDGKTITRTAESWNGLQTQTDLGQKTYTVGEGDTATKGNVTGECNGELELADESRTLKFSNGEVAVSNFTDPGPDWLERVQDRSFETSDKVYKYVFSSDGRSVDYYKNGTKQETWTFYGTEDGNNDKEAKAAYTGSGLVFKHWGFNLKGADDLYCTTGQGSTIYETLNMRTWADPAYFIRSKTDSFANSVKGMTFGLRKKDSEGLFGVDVEWYKFDATGQNVTLTTETYHGDTTTHTYVVSSSSANSASFNSQSATLKTDGAHWTLVIDGDEYVAHYQDPGPSFLNRVKHNPRFVSSDGKTTYTFSEEGRKLQMKHTGSFLGLSDFDYEYVYVQPRDDSSTPNCAVYGSDDAKLYYAGFELTTSDTVIQCSNSSAAWASTVIWDMGYQADLVR